MAREGRCGRCDYGMDNAALVDPDGSTRTPKPGDLGLCLVCAAPLRYTRTGGPQWLTYEELTAAMQEPKSAAMRGRLVTAMLLILTLRPSRVHRKDDA
jgi:hypothetical protein